MAAYNNFISGLLNEDTELLANEITLWHHLTLFRISEYKIKGWFSKHDELKGFLQNRTERLHNSHHLELKKWKFNELATYIKLKPSEQLTILQLNQIGESIETEAVSFLQKQDKEFTGETSEQLVVYLLGKMLKEFSQRFKEQDRQAQEEIVRQMITIVHSMKTEHQATLKEILGVDEFTAEVMQTVIMNESLASALAALMTMIRYTIYYEIGKIAVVLSGVGLASLKLPFSRIFMAVIAFLFTPLAFSSLGLGLTWWSEQYTNNQIKSYLIPVMVMNSLLCTSLRDHSVQEEQVTRFLQYYNNS